MRIMHVPVVKRYTRQSLFPWACQPAQVYPVWSAVGPVYGFQMALLVAHVIDPIRQNSLTHVVGLAHPPIKSTSLAPIQLFVAMYALI